MSVLSQDYPRIRPEKADSQLNGTETKNPRTKLLPSVKTNAAQTFAKKHPQLIKQAKLSFPVDDSRLSKDQRPRTTAAARQTPPPHKHVIPPHMLGDLLYITDFIWTFGEVLQIAPFTLEQLHSSLCSLEETSLLKEILSSLIRIILESCVKDNEPQLLPESHLSLICKLAKLTDINSVVPVCYLTLIGEVLRSPMWKVYAEDSKELGILAKHRLSVASIEDLYYPYCSYEEKVALLVFATHCLFDTKAIHEELASRLEERQRLSKLRQDIKTEIRSVDAKSKSKKVKGKHNSVVRSQTANDKLHKLLDKLRQATEDLSQVTVRTQSLGVDREDREYFVFSFDSASLFVRSPDPIDMPSKPKSEIGYWYVYQSKQEIEQVLNCLSSKGLREAELHAGLTAALPKFKFVERDVAEDRSYTNMYTSFSPADCSLEGIRKALQGLEAGLTRHLAKTSKHWDLPIPRNEWLELVSLQGHWTGLAQLLLDFGIKANTPFKAQVGLLYPADPQNPGDDTHYRRVNLRIWNDYGESFMQWCNLLANCKASNTLHFCIVLFESVLHNYYLKRPDRIVEAKKKVEEMSPIRTRRRRFQEIGDHENRKRLRDTEFEHDDVCFFCLKYGELMCCETCSRVVHPSCIGFECIPTEDWFCDSCQSKKDAIPQTRSRTRLRKAA